MLGEFAVADGRCGWRHVGEEPEIDLVGGGGGAIATWCVELMPWLAAIAAFDCVVAALELAIASSLTHSDGRLHTCENILGECPCVATVYSIFFFSHMPKHNTHGYSHSQK